MSDHIRSLIPFLISIFQSNIQQQMMYAAIQEMDTSFITILMTREEEVRNCLLRYYNDSHLNKSSRSYWRLYNHESYNIWETSIDLLPDAVFKNHFRLTRQQFSGVLGLIRGKISRQNTNMRLSFTPDMRLAIFLRFVATGAPPSVIADLFKVGVATVRGIIVDVAEAIIELLPSPSFPTNMTSLVRRFNRLRNNAFPGVVGAIDGSHIKIDTPCANLADYYCYKKFKSIILLAIAGPDCECLWFHVGFPGRVFRSKWKII